MNDWTGEEILELTQGIIDGISTAVSELRVTLNHATKTFISYADIMNKYKYNNWRKFHHIPMKRRG